MVTPAPPATLDGVIVPKVTPHSARQSCNKETNTDPKTPGYAIQDMEIELLNSQKEIMFLRIFQDLHTSGVGRRHTVCT